MKRLLILFLIPILHGCALSVTARSFDPYSTTHKEQNLDIQLYSSNEVISERGVIFYIPVSPKVERVHEPQRSIFFTFNRVCDDFSIDFNEVKISSQNLGSISPIKVEQFSGKPWQRNNIVRELEAYNQPVSVSSGFNRFKLTYDITGLEIGDSVSIELDKMTCGEMLFKRQIRLNESIRSYHKP